MKKIILLLFSISLYAGNTFGQITITGTASGYQDDVYNPGNYISPSPYPYTLAPDYFDAGTNYYNGKSVAAPGPIGSGTITWKTYFIVRQGKKWLIKYRQYNPYTGFVSGFGTDIIYTTSSNVVYNGNNPPCNANWVDYFGNVYNIQITGNTCVSCTPIAAPTITKTGTDCVSSSFTLTASGCTGTYLWSTGATTASISPSTSGTYSASCVDATACAANSASATISVPVTPPTISSSSASIICGSSVTLTGTCATGTLSWSDGTSTISSTAYLYPKQTTTYTATCTSGSCTATNSAVVAVTNNITVTSNNDGIITTGGSVFLSASCSPSGTLTWANGATAISNNTNVYPTDVVTTYIATCNDLGCIKTKNTVITINNPPAISASSTAICSGLPITLTATGCTSPDVVSWHIQGLFTSIGSGLTQTLNPSSTATYQARCTRGSTTSGFSNTVSVAVTALPNAPTSITSSAGTPVSAGTSVTLTAVGCTSPQTVKWEDNSTINPRVVNPTTTTTYTAKCVSGICESATSATKTVSIIQQITLTGTINYDGVYSNGCYTFSTQVCTGYPTTQSACPTSPDASTNYYSLGQYNTFGYGQASVLTKMIYRKNNIWEIHETPSSGFPCYSYNVNGRKYHTKYQYTTQDPPCNAIWIRDVDNVEVALAISGTACVDACVPPVAPTIVTSGTTCNPVLTASGCGTGTALWSNGSTTNATNPTKNGKYVVLCNFGTNCPSVAASTQISGMIDAPTSVTTGYSLPINPNTNITISAQGCISPQTIKWEDGSTITPRSISPAVTTTYSAKCVSATCESVESTSLLVTVNPPYCPTMTITASPALALGTPSTLTASGCVSPNVVTWGVGGTGITKTVTPTAATTYTAQCSGASCTTSSAGITLYSYLTLSGVTTPDGSINYQLGCFSYTRARLNGNGIGYLYTSGTYCPTPFDAGTNYFTNGFLPSGIYGTGVLSVQSIIRKNNYWEIRLFSDNVADNRLYHTKSKYNTQNPPCTAVWIKDSDGTEVTLTVGISCQNETACPTISITSDTPNPITVGTSAILTATGCSSPNVVTWNTGATGSTLTISPTVAGTYSASCFGAACSSSMASIAITVFNPCPVALALSSTSDDIATGTVTKQANSTNGIITATNKITGNGTKATYQAKNIQLNAGFKVDTGSVFKAEVGGCQ
jgi:large repetitive protein